MLKAMAYGCAILALDTSFNREMLQEGQFGQFFLKSSQSVALSLQDAEKQPEILTNLRLNARNGLTQKYNWDQVTNAYINLFKELTKNGKSRT
jgi:glycosyltransferase involved in cell wall biosynthesis